MKWVCAVNLLGEPTEIMHYSSAQRSANNKCNHSHVRVRSVFFFFLKLNLRHRSIAKHELNIRSDVNVGRADL